jgi:C4-dicarboxylate-binding protein DctP
MGAERFKELVEQNSDGRMTVEVYPNSELYGDEDELQALTGNSVQMIAPASSKLSELARQLLVLDLPFLFEDVNEVQEFTSRDSRSGQAIYENEDLSSNNMQVMGLWGNGFYQFTSNTAIRTPADMQGQRIRITPSDVIRRYIEKWGAETTPMAFAEVFTGLQQGVVDGQYNPYSNIESQQFYKVQNYLTVSNHGYLVYPLVINKEFFESLPDDLQQVVTESADEASTYVSEIAEDDNQESRRVMEESGEIEFIELSAEERQAFKDEVVPSVWNEFSADIGQDVIDELLAKQEQQASQ